MNALERFYRVVDTINEWTGRIMLWFCYPMAFTVGYEVVARYILQSPTLWSWDINKQILAAMGALGGGYALLYGSHVAVDLFSRSLSKRRMAVLNLTTDALTIFSLAILTWYFMTNALFSVRILERDITTFQPPIYPLRVVVAVGTLLLLLQALCNLLKNLTLSLGWEQRQARARSGGAQ